MVGVRGNVSGFNTRPALFAQHSAHPQADRYAYHQALTGLRGRERGQRASSLHQAKKIRQSPLTKGLSGVILTPTSEMTEKSTRSERPDREMHPRLKVHRLSISGEDRLPIRPRAARYSGKENQSGWNHVQTSSVFQTICPSLEILTRGMGFFFTIPQAKKEESP